MEFSREVLLSMYKKMLLIRYFEEKVDEFFARALIHGTTHLYTGEEAIAVGACVHLEKGDFLTSTHRGHGHCISSGADVKRMMAELLGKETGYSHGKGGSMHIADVEAGNLGANGVVGGGIPLAVGAGLTLKMKNSNRMVLCFFGDGAANQGVFHESLNLASIWDLPVVFICENNVYGMSFSVKKAIRAKSIAVRSKAYGIPGKLVDGNDVFAVSDAVEAAAGRARKGKGPSLIECQTYRWKGHSKSDANLYRTQEEIESWKKKCPIKRFREKLIETDVLTIGKAQKIDQEAKKDIEDAVEFAMRSQEPKLQDLEEDVYA